MGSDNQFNGIGWVASRWIKKETNTCTLRSGRLGKQHNVDLSFTLAFSIHTYVMDINTNYTHCQRRQAEAQANIWPSRVVRFICKCRSHMFAELFFRSQTHRFNPNANAKRKRPCNKKTSYSYKMWPRQGRAAACMCVRSFCRQHLHYSCVCHGQLL